MSSSGPGMKTIYVSGIFVGEVPATGDYRTDMEVAREFMKSRGLELTSKPFRAIQGQAFAFASAAKAITTAISVRNQ
jgi:hypothetical protein